MERKALMTTAVLELWRNAYSRSPTTGLIPNCSRRKMQDSPILSMPVQVFTTKKTRAEKIIERATEEELKDEIRSDSITEVSVYINMDMTGTVRLPRRDSLASAFKNLLSLNAYI